MIAVLLALFVLPSPWGAVVIGASIVLEFGEVWLWILFLRRYRISAGAEAMVGELAEVVEPCAPAGRVRLRGEIWKARCPQGLERGERGRVTAVEGLTLILEPER